MSDATKPDYYVRNGITCRDIQRMTIDGAPVSHTVAHCWATAIKYLFRWCYKNGVEDLRKAQRYIDYMIEEAGRGEADIIIVAGRHSRHAGGGGAACGDDAAGGD